MKLNQFPKHRNLFSSDPSISQHPSLQFKNDYTERLYSREAFRFSQNSCIWWYVCIASLLIFSSLWGMINWYCSLTGVLLCIGCYRLNIQDKIAILLLLDAIIFIYALLCSDKGNILEAAGIFLLISISNFLTVKRWVFIVPVGGLISATMRLVCGFSLSPYLFAMCFSCVAAAILEKDHRDLWTLYYTYKKSEIQHKQLYYDCSFASFILNYEGKIVYNNKQAAAFLHERNIPLTMLKGGKLEDAFEDDLKDRFRQLIQNAMVGESNSEEFLMNMPDVSLIMAENSVLGYNISAEPVAWCTGNCIHVSCTDITHFIAIRGMLANQYRNLLVPFSLFSRELERLYESHEPPDTENISIFNKISLELRSILTLHLQLTSRIEHRPEVFDVGVEVQNVIEKSFSRAACRGIEISFTKEEGLNTVYGDKSKLNLLIQGLLEFAIAKGMEESEISLLCGIAPPVEGALMLNFRFNFMSKDLTNEELERLFLVRKSEVKRRSMNDMIDISNKYGVYVTVMDALLVVLRGYVVDCYVQEHNKNKTVIILQIPFQERKTRVEHTPIRLFPNSVELTSGSGTMKWKVNRALSDRTLKTMPAMLDPTGQLEHQIELAKRRRHTTGEDHNLLPKHQEPNIPNIPVESLSIIPELPTYSDITSPVLSQKPNHSVSLIPIPKHKPDDSPAYSPNASDVEENESFQFNSDVSRRKYQKSASRKPYNEVVSDASNISGDLVHTKAITLDLTLSPASQHFKCSKSFPRRKFSKFNPVQQSPQNEFEIRPTVRKFLTSFNPDLSESRYNLLVFEQGPPKILVVEDSEIARKAICEQVKSVVNCEPDIAQNGEEAVEQYLSYSEHGFMYYLILMDIIMPKLDGYQATRKIRDVEKQQSHPRTYIVGLSANEYAESKCKESGMDEFRKIYVVKKPTTIRDMERIIHSRSK